MWDVCIKLELSQKEDDSSPISVLIQLLVYLHISTIC